MTSGNDRVHPLRSSFDDHRRLEDEDNFEKDVWIDSLHDEESNALELHDKGRRMTDYGRQVLEEMTVNKLKLGELAAGSQHLIGREREIMILQGCLQRVCGVHGDTNKDDAASIATASTRSKKSATQRHSELALIRGLSGTGKTALALTLTKPTEAFQNPRGMLVSGKFDMISGTGVDEADDNIPFSGLAMAFGNLCHKVTVGNQTGQLNSQHLDSIRREIREELGDRLFLLTHIIPGLEELIYPQSTKDDDNNGHVHSPRRRSSASDDDTNAATISQQTSYALQMFVRIVNSYVAPLVIVLDDLQWADLASLELIQNILSDHSIHRSHDEELNFRKHLPTTKKGGLMIIGCYRSDEVSHDHRLTKAIHKLKRMAGSSLNLHVYGDGGSSMTLESESTVFMTTIVTELEIGNLTVAQTNHAVMTLLGIDNDESTLALAEICHKRTMGNAFFLIQFIVMLEREGMLHFHLGLMQWRWDESLIEEKTAATNNVVGMMTQQMARLPEDRMHFLKVAACLGSIFYAQTISVAWAYMNRKSGRSHTESHVEEMLEAACELGFVEKIRIGTFKFVHDQIHFAALDFMSASALPRVKAHVGVALLTKLSKEQLDSELFLVTNLLNSGPSDFRQKSRFNMILLNLKSAEKAKRLAAFENAARYCKAGISLLPEDSWSSGFEETLRLYSLGAEVAEYLGDTELMEEYCNIVSQQKECSISDRLRVYNVLMDHFGNKGELERALKLGFSALKEYGFEFPKVSAVAKSQAMSKLRKLHSRPVTQEAISSLPRLVDRDMIDKIRLLFRMAVYLYYAKQSSLYMYTACQVIEWSMSFGYCAYCPASFASAGTMMLSVFGDFSCAALYATNALAILKMLPARLNLTEPRLQYTTIMSLAWHRPIQSLISNVQHGYKVGMQLGDTESAVWCLAFNTHMQFITSRPLETLDEDCRRYTVQMEELHRHIQANFTKCVWQLALNLSSTTRNEKTSIAGEAFGFQDVPEIWSQASPIAVFYRSLEFLQLALYTFFGDFIRGANLAIEKGDKVLQDIPGICSNMPNIFYKGLCCFAAAQTSYNKQVRYRMNAEHFRSLVGSWVKKGNPNVLHYSTFLDAEHFVLKKNVKEAAKRYENTITRAARSGFLQDAALASERYAQCLLRLTDDREGAKYRIQEALRYYGEWGAATKVQDLLKSQQDLLS